MKKHPDSLYNCRLMMSLGGGGRIGELGIGDSDFTHGNQRKKKRNLVLLAAQPVERGVPISVSAKSKRHFVELCVSRNGPRSFVKDKAIKKLKKIFASRLQCDVEIGDDERLFLAGFQSVL
jgi:hypothetical protein